MRHGQPSYDQSVKSQVVELPRRGGLRLIMGATASPEVRGGSPLPTLLRSESRMVRLIAAMAQAVEDDVATIRRTV